MSALSFAELGLLLAMLVFPSLQDPTADAIRALTAGDAEQAIRLLTPLAASADASQRTLFYLGVAQLQIGDAASAHTTLTRADHLPFIRSTAVLNRGLAFQIGVAAMRLGRYDEASERFTRLLEVDPEAVEPRLNAGWILLQEDQGEAALMEFERVLEAQPENAIAHYYTGLVHRSNGRFDAARGSYEAALAANEELVEARLDLARLDLDAAAPDNAERHIELVLRQRPTLAEAHFLHGRVALRRGAAEEAAVAFEEALYLDPEHAGALYNLGRAYAAAGGHAEARASLETFAALSTARRQQRRVGLEAMAETRAELRYRQGLEALRAGDAGEAAARFRAAIEAQTRLDNAAGHLGLAAALRLEGEESAAITALERAVEIDPSLAEAQRLLAELYAVVGRADAAEKARLAYQALVASRRSEQL